MDSPNKPLYELVDRMAVLVAEKKKEEGLLPHIAQRWTFIKEILIEIDCLLNRCGGQMVLNDHELNRVLSTLIEAEHLIRIRKVHLLLVGEKIGEYDGHHFDSVEAFRIFMEKIRYRVDDPLRTYPHRLEIVF